MGERSKGKLSHASSYGSSRADRFHPDINLHEAYRKSYGGNNSSMPNWPRDRRQAGGTDNPTANYYISEPCKRTKKPVNPNSTHLNYSVANDDELLKYPQNHKSHKNKISFINNAGILRKENDYPEDVDNDADDDDDDEEEACEDEFYYENEVNDREEEEDKNPPESCCSCETTEKNNEDPEDENYEDAAAASEFPNKYEKRPLPIFEKLKMLEVAHAQLKMNQQRRYQKNYSDFLKTHRNRQDIQNHEITDDATEDDDESLQLPVRKVPKQPINYRQLSQWLSSRNEDNYNLRRYPQQAYNYPRKYAMKSILEQDLESYGQNRPCRYCGGTGNDLIEPAISRKINCRVNDSTKVKFNAKEKFEGESGDQGERCNGRRISPRMNFLNLPPANISSQKPRRSRNTRSPTRE